MNAVSDYLSVERTENVWRVRFRPLDFMMFERLDVTETMFQLLAEVESKHVKVLRADYPAGSMSPAVVDRFWHAASKAPLVPWGTTRAAAAGSHPQRQHGNSSAVEASAPHHRLVPRFLSR